jgi:hypothetical protein
MNSEVEKLYASDLADEDARICPGLPTSHRKHHFQARSEAEICVAADDFDSRMRSTHVLRIAGRQAETKGMTKGKDRAILNGRKHFANPA